MEIGLIINKISAILAFTLLILAQVACAQSRGEKGKVEPPTPLPSSSQKAVAATGIDSNKLKAQAEEMSKAFVDGDFGKVADSTYPDVVKFVGGRARMVSSLEVGMKQMRTQGFDIEAVVVGDPTQILTLGKQTFAVVPTTMRMKVQQGTLSSESFFLGVSEDGGNTWSFVDGAGVRDKGRLKVLFPAAADKLELPQSKPPVMQQNP